MKIVRPPLKSQVVMHKCEYQMRPLNLAALIDLQRLQLFGFFEIVKLQAGIAAALEPLQSDAATPVDLGLQFGVLDRDFTDRVGGGHIALLPAFGHALLLIMQMAHVFDSTLQDRALVLVAVRNKTGEFVDPLVDGLTTAAFNWIR